ncbi:DUF397 domain-containing protein [Actinopolyspora erythraea]|uniref:DUF397 domain-containing protein n=1 Tax=Actinopolyspora erythraea TaxID=414996 RepID=A0A099DAF4_9ACTN|nr:DUF397 domain-containing protein [Actinopolyspora erythraea]ASU80561.1 DUF397 domain-containing protein [Actinopolyspora erythraea]KGI82762.1 regulator [Actinopolyspora erythraea]
MTVEQHLTWRTSSYSGNTGNCVEVGSAADVVGVRDTKNRDGGTLVFTGDQWGSFLNTVKRSY